VGYKRSNDAYMSTINKLKRPIKGCLSILKRTFLGDPDSFLRHCFGVIHVGANEGQERAFYARLGLRVIWVEPIPEVFARLESNIQSYPAQSAYQCLLTEHDGTQYDLHIASNSGASSSILKFAKHSELWPEIKMDRTIRLPGKTLMRLIDEYEIDIMRYDALVLDTQGSELGILRGSSPILQYFKFIKVEVPDFESYDGCCTLPEMSHFMQQAGFDEYARNRFKHKPGVGSYYDMVYERRKPA